MSESGKYETVWLFHTRDGWQAKDRRGRMLSPVLKLRHQARQFAKSILATKNKRVNVFHIVEDAC